MDDRLDFKSDLNIEVAREGDILKEGQDLKDIKCKKNPGHEGFIPFKDLTLEHLPIEERNREVLDMIKKKGSRVVRLVVDKIKNGRRIKESGSGCVYKLDNEYFIKTNNHVVQTDDEVKHCTVEFHYDYKDKSNVFTSRGVHLHFTCPYRDVTFFTFHHVPGFLHQLDWTCRVITPSIVIMYKNGQEVTLRDYVKTVLTNRFPFQLFYYSPCDLNSSLIHRMFISFTDGSYSYIKSSFIICQPTPSIIQLQELISIEIHIDEDNGNSRVIPGDVVKFGDEFVVEISEFIFQDEVKKCRLVWNGEVIGRGTRLYFQQVKTSDYLKGIDLEEAMKDGRDKYWIIEYGSIEDNLEDMSNKDLSVGMCCIGHPHGGMKKITFGRLLSLSYERFDNQYRHNITQPNSECQCKEVNCVKYSCKTCVGSSGSPVFSLCKGMNSIDAVCHFLGETRKIKMKLSNGELVENINMAWIFTPSNCNLNNHRSELVVSRVAHPVDIAKRFLHSMKVYFILVLILSYVYFEVW